MYTSKLEGLNNAFLGIEIFQILIFLINVYCIFKSKTAYITLMWVEDFVLELPMIAIALYIATFLQAGLTVGLVLFGGLLGIAVCIIETIL